MGWEVWDGFGGACILQMCFEAERFRETALLEWMMFNGF